MFNYDNRTESGEVRGECCGKTEEFVGTFRDCVDTMKRFGWKVQKDDDTGEWYHTCSDCS